MPDQADTRRTVLITGCSQHGLGHALAIAFHHAGLKVFATARNPDKMVGLKELGIKCLKLDVCDEEGIRACVEEVRSLTRADGNEEGRLNCLVNNAGGGEFFIFVFITLLAASVLFSMLVSGGKAKRVS